MSLVEPVGDGVRLGLELVCVAAAPHLRGPRSGLLGDVRQRVVVAVRQAIVHILDHDGLHLVTGLLLISLVDLGDGIDRGIEEIRELVQAHIHAFLEKALEHGPTALFLLLLLLFPRVRLLLRLHGQLDRIRGLALGTVTVALGVRVHDEHVALAGFEILNLDDALLRSRARMAAAPFATGSLLHRNLDWIAVMRQRGESRVWLALHGEVLDRRRVRKHLARDLNRGGVYHCHVRLERNLRYLCPVTRVWIHHNDGRLLSLAKLFCPRFDLRGAVLDGINGLPVVPAAVLNLGVPPIDHALHVQHGGLLAAARAAKLPRPNNLDIPLVPVQVLLNRAHDEEQDLGQDASSGPGEDAGALLHHAWIASLVQFQRADEIHPGVATRGAQVAFPLARDATLEEVRQEVGHLVQ